jgi:hypothetical protein
MELRRRVHPTGLADFIGKVQSRPVANARAFAKRLWSGQAMPERRWCIIHGD